jgi:tetratricopeptide (TPR) repeat protein
LRADSQLVEAHFNLGLALERTGHLDAAQAEFKAALRLRPGLAPAQEHLQEIATRRAILPHD